MLFPIHLKNINVGTKLIIESAFLDKKWFAKLLFLSPDCPKNPMWSKFGTKYYGSSYEQFAFNDSASFCAAQGGQLASISTEQDYYQLASVKGNGEHSLALLDHPLQTFPCSKPRRQPPHRPGEPWHLQLHLCRSMLLHPEDHGGPGSGNGHLCQGGQPGVQLGWGILNAEMFVPRQLLIDKVVEMVAFVEMQGFILLSELCGHMVKVQLRKNFCHNLCYL